MTPDRLRDMIEKGETLSVEFKGEEREPLSDKDLVEAVVCLANRPGGDPGWLLIGVEDDGRVTGARPRHGSTTDPRRLQALMANRTSPSTVCPAETIALDGKDVLVIEVPSARTPVCTTQGLYVRRAIGGKGKPECLPFHFHEMQARRADRGEADYSTLVVPEARWEDLDPLEFDRYRRNVRESRDRGDASLADLPDIEMASPTSSSFGFSSRRAAAGTRSDSTTWFS